LIRFSLLSQDSIEETKINYITNGLNWERNEKEKTQNKIRTENANEGINFFVLDSISFFFFSSSSSLFAFKIIGENSLILLFIHLN